MKTLRYYWDYLLAFLRLDEKAVCRMSIGRGIHNDFHDYDDSEDGIPDHFVIMKCQRCGKEFQI